MDGRRFDGLSRRIGAAATRRAMLRAGIATALSGVGAWALSPDAAEARHNACEARCGGERRQCRQRCRYKDVFMRPCKRGCDILRDYCDRLCEFR